MNEARTEITRKVLPAVHVAPVRIDAEPTAQCAGCGHWVAEIPGSRHADDYAHTIETDPALTDPICDAPQARTCDACGDAAPIGDRACLIHSGASAWED